MYPFKKAGMVNRPRTRITRRNFAGICVGAAAAGASALDSISRVQGQAISTPTGSGNIDQNPIRRRGTGLRALDIARACPGLTLFSPLAGDGIVYLISLDGRLVHTWKMPYPPGLYGYLTETGTLFYSGKIPNDTFLGKSPFKGGAALEADWNGSATELPDEIAKRVRGGRPGTEVAGKMWADYLVEKTKNGRTVWEWRTWEHLDPAEEVL